MNLFFRNPSVFQTFPEIPAFLPVFIRRELFARLKMRKSPELHFIADDSIAYAADISEKLSGLGLTAGNSPVAEPEEEQDF